MKSFAFVLCATLALSACAGTSGTVRKSAAADPAIAVQARAQQRWDHLIQAQFEQAWEFFSPGYRSTSPKATWAANMKGRAVKWSAARATAATCQKDEDYCDVTVQVDFVAQSTLQQVGEIEATAPVYERWIRVKGGWYFVPDTVARPQ